MNASGYNADRLLRLSEAVCDGSASADDLAELNAVLRESDEARRNYLDFCRLHFTLGLELRARLLSQRVHQQIGREISPLPADDISPENCGAPPIAFLPQAAPGMDGLLSGWPVAYLLSAIICGIGLAIGSLVHVSRPAQLAEIATPHASFSRAARDASVGQITGTFDCRWERRGLGVGDWGLEEGSRSKDQGSRSKQLQSRNLQISKSPNSNPQSLIPNPSLTTNHYPLTTPHKSLVYLGDRFVLSSGLMEIAYKTGARVILQGPCTYEVDSRDGGFLSIGKLTARVEKSTKYEVRSTERVASESSLTTNHYPLFTIKTPTAVVADLGTEFGVEVDERGGTASYVFQGAVSVQTIAGGGKVQNQGRILRENESIRVDRRADKGLNVALSTFTSSPPRDFVRELPKPTVKTLDLVDVVAGGDGFSGRRNAGIDPMTGRPTDTPPADFNIHGDGEYRRVEALPLIDGVFIPSGSEQPVQVDSAGHTFDGFLIGHNMTYGYVWAGGAVPTGVPPTVRTTLGNIDYAAPGHGLIFLHANKGVTFDLEAIRRANPGWKLGRFLATAGNSEVASQGILGPLDRETAGAVSADVRVLIDGDSRWHRREINGSYGGFDVAVPIAPQDRFLTLTATDSGNGIHADWIMFGDPRIELLPDRNGISGDSDLNKGTGESVQSGNRGRK